MIGPEQLQSYVRGNVLTQGESLLWQGRGKPPSTLKFRWIGERPGLISMGWLLALLSALAFALDAPLSLTLPAALVGLWLAGAGLRDAKHLSRSFYFITDQRAFRVEVGQRVKISEQPQSALRQAQLQNQDLVLSYQNGSTLSFRYTTDADGGLAQAKKQIR